MGGALLALDSLPLFLHWQTIEEKLTRPKTVLRLTEQGLVLSDGSVVPLQGIDRLPINEPQLNALVDQQVEVTSDGHVIGLFKIWHWCGHDPVGRHIARVDVGHLLRYFGHGHVPKRAEGFRARGDENPLDPYGWNVSGYNRFHWFESARTLTQ